jgi:hypothetical protein
LKFSESHAYTLEDDEADEWFKSCGRKEKSSFASFIKVFCKYRDPSYEEEHVEDCLINEPHDVQYTYDVFHEKGREIEDFMIAFYSKPLNVLYVEIKDKVEACKAFVAVMEEKCCGSINECHGDEN